jgi:hypothetical protein
MVVTTVAMIAEQTKAETNKALKILKFIFTSPLLVSFGNGHKNG